MDLSTRGIVALVRNPEGKFLLLEDSREQMRGCWAPPHGRCEVSDFTEEAGVVRETFEETGLQVRPLRALLTQPADTKVKTVSFWLVNVVGGNLRIDPSESSNHGWFSVDEALRLRLYPGTRKFFSRVAAGEIKLI